MNHRDIIRFTGYCVIKSILPVGSFDILSAESFFKENYVQVCWVFCVIQLSGARRLRDAIILGYQLQRVPGRDIAIPEWYSRAENEIGQSAGSSPTVQANENNSLVES